MSSSLNAPTEPSYVLINHGRIYSAPLNGPNPKGMTAWFDRRVFAERGYKVMGCMSTYNIRCVPLDPNNVFDQALIHMEHKFEGLNA